MAQILIDGSVLEQALEALGENEWGTAYHDFQVTTALRAALNRPQQPGWKLVPVEPTAQMLACLPGAYASQRISFWENVLAAAPQPPVEQEPVEQEPVEQEPVVWANPCVLEWGRRESEKVEKLTRREQSIYGFTVPLYTHPQPQCKPLTVERIQSIHSTINWREMGGALVFAREIERAHGITGSEE